MSLKTESKHRKACPICRKTIVNVSHNLPANAMVATLIKTDAKRERSAALLAESARLDKIPRDGLDVARYRRSLRATDTVAVDAAAVDDIRHPIFFGGLMAGLGPPVMRAHLSRVRGWHDDDDSCNSYEEDDYDDDDFSFAKPFSRSDCQECVGRSS
jgi:hypothetical protein